jgi:hypothetical protein
MYVLILFLSFFVVKKRTLKEEKRVEEQNERKKCRTALYSNILSPSFLDACVNNVCKYKTFGFFRVNFH